MKILVICQYYAPEPFRHPVFCEELVNRGHEVAVVTGLPNYPMGEIYEGYRHGEKRDEVINGVKVHRCYTIGRKSGVLNRFLNYYSYVISSTKYVRKLDDEFDVILVNQLSPVMMASAGIAYKKKHRKKLVLYCLDLWPESLCVGGIRRGSLIYKYFHKVSEKIYAQADKILLTSKSFVDYFSEEFGITNTEYLPQYAEVFFSPAQCAKDPNEYFDLMFAGNLGIAQSVSTIIEAARLTKDVSNIRWHIVGDGSEFDSLKSQAEGLGNVIFYGRKAVAEMPKYYSMADVMLVTMYKNPVLGMTLPGKVQTYMAAGKPVLGAIDGEAYSVINNSNCGYCCEAENAKALAELALKMMKSNLERFSENAVEYYRTFFEQQMFLTKLEETLQTFSHK